MFGFGLMCAVWESARSGRGQIVDAAMVDSSAYLMTMIQGFRHAGVWTGNRADNVIDGGAPFYGAYPTSDGKYIAVGAIEEKFYDQLLRQLGLEGDAAMKPQMDRAKWPGPARQDRRRDFTPLPPGMVRAPRGNRRLLCAGPFAGRGRKPPASARTQHLHRGSWIFPARAGAAFQS